MAEITKRGEEDRRREDEEMTGEPLGAAARGEGARPTATTRDKGASPAADQTGEEREGHR
jgi:hypothetical protein